MILTMYNPLKKIFLLTLAIVSLLACMHGHKNKPGPEVYFKDKNILSKIHYARLFDIYETDGIKKVVVHNPFSDTIATSVLYIVNKAQYKLFKDKKNVIQYPLSRIAVLSATQLNSIVRLKLLDCIAGISDAKYISSKKILKRITQGKITEVSANGHLFTEKTIMLNPDAIFFSPYEQGQTLPVHGTIKVLPFFDFMEDNPLGRAEWIKFSAAFLGNEAGADSIFSTIEHTYNRLKSLAEKTEKKPSVFSGKYFNGQWFVPGGKSYMARLFNDAGATYVWKEDSSRNSIPLDFEVVLQKARQADYWRMLGGLSEENSYQDLERENQLYGYFKAFKQHHIIYCNPAATGYFEKSVMEPQVILKDLIHAFHPQMFPNYKPVYYKILP